MKTLDLHRIWEILNFISEQEQILNDKDIYPYFLGMNSSFYGMDFDSFIGHYSFRIDKDEICIFNDDPIPYEDYTINDFSYIPKELLSFNDNELMAWIEKQTEIHLSILEEIEEEEKESLKNQIKMLTEKLNKLC